VNWFIPAYAVLTYCVEHGMTESAMQHPEPRAMKGKSQTQGKGFGYLMAVPIAVLVFLAAKTVYDYAYTPFGYARFQGITARPATYLAEPSEPFCLMQGVWHNWEKDETITLGCIEVKGNIREGSYSSATGPRAVSNFSIKGTYDIRSDSSMRIIIKDRQGKGVEFNVPIYVDDTEYPTQLVFVDKEGEKNLYIWKRKE
jgi:hypothetical protein